MFTTISADHPRILVRTGTSFDPGFYYPVFSQNLRDCRAVVPSMSRNQCEGGGQHGWWATCWPPGLLTGWRYIYFEILRYINFEILRYIEVSGNTPCIALLGTTSWWWWDSGSGQWSLWSSSRERHCGAMGWERQWKQSCWAAGAAITGYQVLTNL